MRTSSVRGARRGAIDTGGREFVALIAGLMAMAAVATDMMLPAFPEMREEFGLAADANEVSVVVTTFFLGLSVGQVFYGPLSDRWGRKPMLYVGLGVYVLAGVGATVAPTLGLAAAARFLWGFGAAAPRSVALAVVRDSFDGERMASVMAKVMAVFILVPVFAPTLGAAVVAVAPWRGVFVVPVLGALAVSAWLVRLPESLPPERRRTAGLASLRRAFAVVVRTRATVGYGLAITMLFGILVSFVAGMQTIIDVVYDREELFPFLFGAIASVLGLTSLFSGRLVAAVGLASVARWGGVYTVVAATVFASVVAATGGAPPLWAFCVMVAAVLPGVAVLIPACNSAAMDPVPQVAGMAAAVLGSISTGVGAGLGAVVDAAFDESVGPFATGAVVFAALAAVAIFAATPLRGARAAPRAPQR